MPTTSGNDVRSLKRRRRSVSENRSFADRFRRRTNPSRELRAFEEKSAGYSDQQMLDAANRLRESIGETKLRSSHVLEFGGLIAESVFRHFGFRLHDVQVDALLAGSRGSIVEMQTGEGKTVVTGALAALLTLNQPSVHVATTNTYLAQRDFNNLTAVFQQLGIGCGLLPEGHDEQAARNAYQQQIVYGPGYQFGFDYLRDQVVLRANRQSRLGIRTLNAIRGDDPTRVLRQSGGFHAILVDEADSVMIDEALTPLVISGTSRPAESSGEFLLARRIALTLNAGEDYAIEGAGSRIRIHDTAEARCHAKIEHRTKMRLERPWRIYIANALRAEYVLERDVDYVVVDGEVKIVDQYTGRIFTDRSWQDGLHEAVQAKEGVEVRTAENSRARITRQRYLQMYETLAGLTGTASAVAREFASIYRVPVVQIPTNLPCIRKNLHARFFRDSEAKLEAIVEDVSRRHPSGQPILIGTRTIKESRQVADAMKASGIDAVVLNGLQDEEEAEIISMAGQSGALTIATNMAGRGTDIQPDERAIAAGGLHVIGYSPNMSARIDRQLIGRAARQGNPGSSQLFGSADDEIFSNHSTQLVRRIRRSAVATGEAKFDVAKELLALQKRLEARNFALRQSMIRQDFWMDRVRQSIDQE